MTSHGLTYYNYSFLGVRTSSGYENSRGTSVRVNRTSDFEGSISYSGQSSSGFGATTTTFTSTTINFSRGTATQTENSTSFTSVPP